MTLTEILNKAERIVGLYIPHDKTRNAILQEAHEKRPFIKSLHLGECGTPGGFL